MPSPKGIHTSRLLSIHKYYRRKLKKIIKCQTLIFIRFFQTLIFICLLIQSCCIGLSIDRIAPRVFCTLSFKKKIIYARHLYMPTFYRELLGTNDARAKTFVISPREPPMRDCNVEFWHF